MSVNVGKTEYLLFHKSRGSDDLQLRLPALEVNENEIVRADSIKSFRILKDEKASWKQHPRYVEKKVVKGFFR